MTGDVTVLVATFNGGQYLAAQLASLKAQTMPPLEIVITDDGSTDDTFSIVNAFCHETTVPVHFIKGVGGLGASQNFLASLHHCRGRYIAYCDQDDVWHPDKLRLARGRLKSDQSLLAIHQSTLTNSALSPTGLMTQGIRRDSVFPPGGLDPYLGEFSGWGNTMVFDAGLIPLLLTPRPIQPHQEHPLSHDTWTYVLAAALGRVSHVATPLILYRQHDANVYGVQVESPWSRLRSSAKSPVSIYSARSDFYNQCALVFRGVHESSDKPTYDFDWAARLYERRAAKVLLRRGIYARGTRLKRLSSFISFYFLNRSPLVFGERAGLWRLTSMIKDLLTGVWEGPRLQPPALASGADRESKEAGVQL